MTLIHWLVSAVAILIAAYLIPGVTITSLVSVLVLAVVLAIINVFFKPIITLITLPINIVTLGIFSLVVNALLIMLAAMIVPGFHVNGFWAAFFFSIVVSLVTALFGMMSRKAV
ncbi:MAG: rane protein of unknown function [Parcubacteria group bacterium]|nr:rane protein of unknown function [Parcubacteria group bacterium]